MDSQAIIVRSLQRAAADLQLPIPADHACRQVIGLELSLAIRQAMPQAPLPLLPNLVERYRHHFLGSDHEVSLFPGMGELIPSLHQAGHVLAIATGKSRIGLNRALAACGLQPYFSASRTADDCASKPNPQMLVQLMDELAHDEAHTLMIGDTSHDLQMAQNAGTASLAVAYGAHDVAHLRNFSPLACVDSVLGLGQWLQQHG